MKKAAAILIAIIMMLSLVACNSNTPANTPATNGGGNSSNTSSAPPSASNSSQPSAPSEIPQIPSGEKEVEPEGNPSSNLNSIGFFFDGVDPYSRKTYDIVWAYMRPMALFQSINDALDELAPIFNVNIIPYMANSDIDAMIQNIEIFADQGADGFIIVIDASANMRIKEVLDATGLPYIGILNSVRDANGSSIVPLIGMDGFPLGHAMVQWLTDNHQKYWGTVDKSKIGLLNFTFSPNIDFHERYLGNEDLFKTLYPGNPIFPADGVTGGLNEQTGYDLAAAIFSANPDVEYWYVPACLELYALGATRAAEALGIDDRVLVVAVNSDVLTTAWREGYEGCFVSCIATDALQYAAPAMSGIVSMINGTTTMETLWEDMRAPNDQKTYFLMDTVLLTIDTYEDFFAQVRAESGLS